MTTSVAATLTVDKLTPAITWVTPSAITYGTALSGTQLKATASVTGTFTYNPAAGVVLGAGSNRALSVTFTPTDAVNYATATSSTTIIVNKAPLTAKANDKGKSQGAANPTLTISYTGFVNNETETVITAPAISTTATTTSPAGTYPITLTGGSAENYTFILESGTFTVRPSDLAPAITSANAATFIVGQAATFTVTATGSPSPTFSVTGGTFPSWATLNASSGIISGTPTNGTGSPFTFTLTAANGVSPNATQPFTLAVNLPATAPTITTQPQNQSVTAGANATFTAAASGTPAPTLQWQLSTNGGISWTDLANNTLYSGVTTGTLNITGATLALNAYHYRCVATNGSGSANSTAAILTVNAASGGTVVAWGGSGFGQTTVPAGLDGVAAIAAGSSHSLALKSDGTVVAWGDNGYGQTTVPAGLSGVTAIATSNLHTVALKSDGTVVAWGLNNHGQATIPGGLSGVTSIAAGALHTVALKSNGTVVAWGNNSSGQATVPAGLSGVTAIAARGNHTVVLKSDGTVVAWGNNIYGQATVPAGLSGVMAIAAGNFHTVALKGDGTVVAWGYNNFGQITIPAGLSGVTAIAAGLAHTVVLKNDGTVVAWGQNLYGQTNVLAGLNGVTAVAAGENHTVALVGTATAIAPTIITQPVGLTVNAGENVSFTVVATGTAPFSYQWRKGGVARSGATQASLTLTNVQPADSGSYDVVVSNGVLPDATSNPARLNVVPNGVTATHSIASVSLNAAGGTLTISNRFGYLGPVTNLQWSVVLPTGWSFVSSDATSADVKPVAGATRLLEWGWATLPASPVSFAYTLTLPAGDVAPRPLAALVDFKYDGTPIQVTAKPDPLMAGFSHAADTDRDFRISLLELTRVIELYNTRKGTQRTGAYRVQDGTEDGFGADATRDPGSAATLSRYHSADTTVNGPRDGRINLGELTRVIQLYNHRAGTVRTGQYHADPTNLEDGYAPGP